MGCNIHTYCKNELGFKVGVDEKVHFEIREIVF